MGIDRAIRGPLGLVRGYPVGWFAPEYKLLKQAWLDIREILAPITISASDQDKRIELLTGGTFEGWAFDRNPHAGRSRRYGTIIIDEAAHCDHLETAWGKAIRPTLTDYQGHAWFISSPNGPTFFHSLYKRGQSGAKGWKSWTQTSYDNPYILASEIDSARDDIGDWAFDQEYLAVFHAEAVDGLFRTFWVDRLPSVAAESDRLRQTGQGGKKILSVDLGEGTGRDLFVALVRDDLGIIAVRASAFIGIPEAATVINELSYHYNIRQECIVYDAGGRGKDLPRYLEHHRITEALPYHGSGAGGHRFTNRRAKMGWKLRQRLDPERPRPLAQPLLPPDHKPSPFDPLTKPIAAAIQPPFAYAGPPEHWPALAEELKALRYETQGPKIALENKSDLMKRIGRSPNYVDALLMSFYVSDDT